MKVGKVRATLVEIWSRAIKIVKDKNGNVYWNGEDNLYPNEIEGVINNSPTALKASKIVGKYISGSGVIDASTGDVFDYEKMPFVNEKKFYKLPDVISIAANDMARQGGVWFHVGYGVNENGLLYQKTIDVLPYAKCRISKEDDEGNPGKIIFKDFTAKQMFGAKEKQKWFYPYNPNLEVVKAQIKADSPDSEDLAASINRYRGQVYYMNLTPEYKYALAPIDSAFNDADTEYRIGLYTNTQSRRGFLGKLIAVTQGLDEEMAKKTDEDLAKFLGTEDSADFYHVDVDQADDITKVIHFEQLKPQFDDKLFLEADRRIRRNILGVNDSIPEALINSSEGSLFGTQADTYTEMKMFLTEQVEDKQNKLERTLSFLGFPCKIQPIVQKETAATSDKQADAQAALKGSVGGVTALIALQQSVSAGTTTFNSAVQIIETIYGIDRETAIKMVGDPIEAPITETPTENV